MDKSSSSDSGEGEMLNEPANAIDPYSVLSIQRSATQDEIRSAYRKAALKNHPDKAKPGDKNAANSKFQEIATAYAILSDEKRKLRYDTTGNTAESLDDDDFDWMDFFRAQSDAVISGAMIEQIKQEYQGSEEEHQDVLQIYEESEGNMDMVYETIMCSNILEDDERFRKYIDDAIRENRVRRYAKYAQESNETKRRRVKRAKHEEKEALELAEELGVKDKLFGNERNSKKSKKAGDDDHALKALIQQRQVDRSANFFDQLEAKYGGKKSKRKAEDEPPEELFQVNARRRKGKA